MKLDKQPDPRIIYKYNELDLGRINGPVLVQRVSQNPTVMHGHRDFVEMVFVTGGSCLHEISTGESYVIGTGDVFFVRKAPRTAIRKWTP
jgi:redox-sensitive bicupin YhaK (pirin superfamily)